MQNLFLTRRLVKTASLIFVTIGFCLHVYLTYSSPLLAILVFIAIGIVDSMTLYVLWPHVAAHKPLRKVHA